MATLLALAALAERAGARSYPVRVLALCFLRPAEAIACEFVAEVAPAQRLAGNALLSNGSDDPVGLAARFRALPGPTAWSTKLRPALAGIRSHPAFVRRNLTTRHEMRSPTEFATTSYALSRNRLVIG